MRAEFLLERDRLSICSFLVRVLQFTASLDNTKFETLIVMCHYANLLIKSRSLPISDPTRDGDKRPRLDDDTEIDFNAEG